MFAHPFSAPLSSTLGGHLFGRFTASSAPVSSCGGAGASVADAAAASLAADEGDDGAPDLAQRVREVGEW
ncbi:hypothetical protein C8C99_1632 [Acidovorax sp. 107]|nr:hypothetical protein C8C99_1632 [Acidovorax sp. 107]